MMNEKINQVISPTCLDEAGVCKIVDARSWSRQLSALHGYCSRIP